MFPGMPAGFDPSQMDPRLIGEISQLMGTLPPEMMMKMQTLMHNAMAGHDVKTEMEAFERGLPDGFREKMARILYQANGVDLGNLSSQNSSITSGAPAKVESVQDARLMILHAVRDGQITPEAALTALFPE
ncbi:MAG: hypothetical protein H7301_03005 [Cryobacterium sp.]|nr:hypothetical protein [Oligoflexia bacterium]